MKFIDRQLVVRFARALASLVRKTENQSQESAAAETKHPLGDAAMTAPSAEGDLALADLARRVDAEIWKKIEVDPVATLALGAMIARSTSRTAKRVLVDSSSVSRSFPKGRTPWVR